MNTFMQDALVNGRPAQLECVEILGQTYSRSRGILTTVQLDDEWFEDLRDVHSVISALQTSSLNADILTFWQRLPYTTPEYAFHTEWDAIAALRVTTFDDWWSKQIKPETRNLVRKAQKRGVDVREATFSDDFIHGMTEIFNEAPIRQGRRFWHYGKDADTVKQQFSKYLSRETLLGAYYGDELIGFIMLGDAGRYGVIGQIISKIQHRDKSPNNALVAKAVEVCEKRGLSALVYAYWGDGSLVDFKRHNGFEQVRLPRYYVPLTRKGELAIATGVHRGLKALLPETLKTQLKSVRSRWLSLTHRSRSAACRA
jgi:hypothetical protein